MPTGDPQDSRDPNSPQWGYLKIDNPKEKITDQNYPGKDDSWNNFVMFVHDKAKTNAQSLGDKIGPNSSGKVKFVMVPATISINVADVETSLDITDPDITSEEVQTIKNSLQDNIHIPSGKGGTEKTKLWIALVVGKG